MKSILAPAFILFLLACSCKPATDQQEETTKSLSFDQKQISDSVRFIWANCPADITGDGIADLVFSDNNSYGGQLGYYTGDTSKFLWQKSIIAEEAPDGGTFASGDLTCADADFDGDIDIFAVEHDGEWESAGEPSVIYWYENPGWQAHRIGEVPNFVKDMAVADFNQDQKMDIALLTFENSTFTIFQQEEKDLWTIVQSFRDFMNVHEGMGEGDVNGDGFIDVVVNGHVLFNPSGDLTAEWATANVDSIWNNQTGDWSRNATKIFVKDINQDNRAEIFISHSEKAGYPLAMYRYQENGQWQKDVIADSIPACHTLQVADFNQDDNMDVMAGINRSRALTLNKSSFDVTIFLGNEDYSQWEPFVVTEDGIYNGQASDFDGDGDPDIFRYPTHDATAFYLLINELK